jgi:hypothetical protein
VLKVGAQLGRKKQKKAVVGERVWQTPSPDNGDCIDLNAPESSASTIRRAVDHG